MRNRKRSYFALVVGVILCAAAALVVSAPATASPAAAGATILESSGATAATLSDYWAGTAEWELYEFYPKSRYAHDAGDGGYGAGPMIRVGPDGSWNLFTRTLWIPGGDCSEQGGFSSGTVVRTSTDRGHTWSASSPVVTPAPNTPWACGATDGDAYFDGARWHYLFQCQTHAGDLARGGPFWNICHIQNNGPDATSGWDPKPDENPVMGDYPGGYSPWPHICDQPTDRCSQLGGGAGNVKQAGTPSIFDVPSEPGWHFVDIHGIDQDLRFEQRGNQFVGIIKTRDFKTFVAGSGSNLPTDAIFSPDDAMNWREPTGDWQATQIGGGGGSVYHDPNDGKYYHVVEASNGGHPGYCFQASAMNIGILRADSPATTTGHWEQPSRPGRENPIFYSQDTVSDDWVPTRCTPSYESIFHDPVAGETFMVFLKRSSEDDSHEGVYVFRLQHNLLKNADAWRCVDVAPWHLTDPTVLASAFNIRRDGNWSTDGQCHFAFQSGISQEIDLPTDRTYSAVDWGGKFAARVSALYPPSGFQSLAGSANMSVTLTQLNAAGTVVATDTLPVVLPPEIVGAYAPFATSVTLTPSTAKLRYSVNMDPNTLILTVLADEMFVRAKAAPAVATTTTYTGATTARSGSDVPLSATVTTADSGPVSGVPVTFSWGGSSATGTSGADGVATGTLPAGPAGDHTLSVSFGGSRGYAPSSTSSTLHVFDVRLIPVAPAAPISGGSTAISVKAVEDNGAAYTAWSDAPVLSSSDRHATMPACGLPSGGVATCAGVVFGDLGPQSLTASAPNGYLPGTTDLTVQPTGLVFVDPPSAARRGVPVTYTTAPTAGVPGALLDGYRAIQAMSTNGKSDVVPPPRHCSGASCSLTVTFGSGGGTRTVLIQDTSAPSRSASTSTKVTG